VVINDSVCSTPNWALTIDELKSHHGFENVTEEKAKEIIESMMRLALIAYNAK